MDVQVGLLIFAHNTNHVINHYVLMQEIQGMQEKNGFFKIPQKPLPEHLDSVSLVHGIIKECSGVSGRWIEMTPKQVGVFDDVDRNPSRREIFIAYSLYIPEPMRVYEGYKWIKMDELSESCLFLDSEQIIRYTILGGDKYVV